MCNLSTASLWLHDQQMLPYYVTMLEGR